MKRHLAIIAVALLALTAIAGKKEPAKKATPLADQRKAEYIFVQAQSEKLKDNYDAFYDLLAYAHKIDPENTAISFYMGMCLLKMNNTTKEMCEEGLALMKEHFEAQPEDLYETTFYSDANMQLGHPEEALRAIKVLNENNPNPSNCSCAWPRPMPSRGITRRAMPRLTASPTSLATRFRSRRARSTTTWR